MHEYDRLTLPGVQHLWARASRNYCVLLVYRQAVCLVQRQQQATKQRVHNGWILCMAMQVWIRS